MGVYLSTPKTSKASEDGEDDRHKFGASSMQGWRSTMEDAHAALLDLDDSTAFFGVYDGHGGKQVARFCAKYLHQQVLKQEAYLNGGDLCDALRHAFLRMDEMMSGERGWRELATMGDTMDQITGKIEGFFWHRHHAENEEHKHHEENTEHKHHTHHREHKEHKHHADHKEHKHHTDHKEHKHHSENTEQADDWTPEKGPHSDFEGPKYGSTACVAVVRENTLIVANAGDSRCVISRSGQAYNMSKDHKPELKSEKERIYAAGGYIYGGRVNRTLNLARAIGDAELKRDHSRTAEEQIVTANPDITTVELDGNDEFIVLACDGIWDCMSSQELVDFVHEQLISESKLSAVIESVFDKCIAPKPSGAGCDNMTMILVLFKNSNYYRFVFSKKHHPHPSRHNSGDGSSSSEP
ncbi:hypothetical protein DCAR_0729418 [Daucus carota subsp. sativus]|uniref:protein-serine/threonine phosphatase n=1 Tax=Daucus carota subsp. sativus TaxID=79200 RepID=A0AAF0XMV7_DAUCS|nr:PREDICTED: probable protein phosphatase 2C 60 [Daucus carota subsp. sativus]WOH09957.1 hypothetical protein DCAR_0729418 [Daucus carota subsp. sativus]